jgi:hypothetical protein
MGDLNRCGCCGYFFDDSGGHSDGCHCGDTCLRCAGIIGEAFAGEQPCVCEIPDPEEWITEGNQKFLTPDSFSKRLDMGHRFGQHEAKLERELLERRRGKK